ncbi:MAG: hypothetical protein QW570_09090 [Candidatus Caldarchaeum sp.]
MKRVAVQGLVMGVCLFVVILNGLICLAQLNAPQTPNFTIDGGSPSKGTSFVAAVFLITEPSGGQSGDTLKGIVISNSPASAPQAQGADVASVSLYIRDTSSFSCSVSDFNTSSGSNGLVSANWSLVSGVSGPLSGNFNIAIGSGGGVEISTFIPFPDNTTRCFAIVIQLSNTATAGRKFRLQVAARKGDNNLTAPTTLNAFENVIKEGPSVTDQALGSSFSTVNAGATNQVLQILQLGDSERGTNGSTNGNLDPDGNSAVLTSVVVHNADAPAPKADSSDIIALKLFYIPTSGGSTCPAPQSNGNPPAAAVQIASLSGGALANFATTGVTFSGLAIFVNDEAVGNNMGCLYVVADLLGVNGRNFKTTTGVSGVEGPSGSFTDVPPGGAPAGTVRTISGTASAGCETFSALTGIGPSTILRGTVGFDASNLNGRVMEFRCVDTDPDTSSVTINSVTITQASGATAQAGSDISRIAIYQCAGTCTSGDINASQRVGSVTVTSFPVTIPLSSALIPDNGSDTFAVVVDVPTGATVGRTIQFVLTANVTEGSVTLTHGPVTDDLASTIQAGPSCDLSQVRIVPATPSRVRFTQPSQQRTIRVVIYNNSGQTISIDDVVELYDELLIVSTAPDLPVTVNNRRRQILRVTVEGPEEVPATFWRPYFDITFTCADGTSDTRPASRASQALEVRNVIAEAVGETLRFSVQGHSISGISVQLFDLMGRVVGQADADGPVVMLKAQDRSGQRLAPGVYLYIMTVRSPDGQVWRSEVRKLIVR